MASRVPVQIAASLCGRSVNTIRAWLDEEPCPLSVVEGHWRGGHRAPGGKVRKHKTRLLDVRELQEVNAARGGTWHPEKMPERFTNGSADGLAAEVAALRERIEHLERLLGIGTRPIAPYMPVARPEPILGAEPTRVPYQPPKPRQRPVSNAQPGLPRPPEGALSPNMFADNHGVYRRSLHSAIEDGRIPQPMPGPFKARSGGIPVKEVYTREQQRQVIEHIRTWEGYRQCEDLACPCRDLPARDPAATRPLAGVLAERIEPGS